MSFSSRFADRLNQRFPDSWNPILVKELRQSIRSGVLPCCLAIVILLELMVLYGVLTQAPGNEQIGQTLLSGIYLPIYFVLLLFAGGQIAMRWANERAEDGLAPEYNTPLSAGQIVSGKYQAMGFSCLAVFLLGLPGFLALPYARTMNLDQYIGLFLGMAAVISLLPGLFLMRAPSQKRRGAGSVFLVLVLLYLPAGPFFVFFLADAFNPTGTAAAADNFLGIQLFFTLSVMALAVMTAAALIRPKTANRFLPVRVALVIFCIAAYPVLKFLLNSDHPENPWGTLCAFVGVLAMLSTVNANLFLSRRRRLEREGFWRIVFGDGLVSGWFFGFILMLAGVAALLREDYLSQSFHHLKLIYIVVLLAFYSAVAGWFHWRQPSRNAFYVLWGVAVLGNVLPIFYLMQDSLPYMTVLSLGGAGCIQPESAALTAAGVLGLLALLLMLTAAVATRYGTRQNDDDRP